jgi:hypothetical protein
MALKDFTSHQAAVPFDRTNKHFLIRNTIDCSKSTGGGFGTLLSSDTARVLEIKEGWFVNRVWVRTIQKGTIASAIESIGDSVGAAVWMATDFAWGSAGTVGAVQGGLHTDTNGALNGYLYLTPDYILVTPKTQNYDGICEFVAEVIDVFGGLTIS